MKMKYFKRACDGVWSGNKEKGKYLRNRKNRVNGLGT